ncbi:MAG: response regulator [Acidobacteria bacterium]|nr:response regulator [Acidobacteriota bacterium]
MAQPLESLSQSFNTETAPEAASGVRIAVVEDEVIIARELEARLVELGYEVTGIASSGERAVQLVRETRPDVVLMDIVLKGHMDGIEAAGEIRRLTGTPVIYVSAYAADDIVRRAVETEPFGYIVKPFTERELRVNIAIAVYKDRMERKVCKAERWLAATLRSIPDAVLATDEDGRVTTLNPAMESLLGRRSDQALGRPVSEILSARDARTGEPLAALDPVVLRRRIYAEPPAEIVVVSREGREVSVERKAVSIRDDRSECAGAVLVLRDLSELMQAQEALRASEERYRLLFERNLAGVFRSTIEGRIIECNRAFARIFGFETPDELVGTSTHALFLDPSDRDRLITRIQAQRTLVNLEVAGKRRDRQPVRILENVSLIEQSTGEPAYLEGTIIDITEMKELEERYRQSQKMEAIGRLAGGIAHDFNNLLTAILGFSDIMMVQLGESHSLAPPLIEIRKAGERAASLTRQLLAFGRKQVLIPQIISLNAIVAELNKILRRVIGEDIELVTKLDPSLATVRADPGQLEQVIMNLVVNARDAMPAGGILTIETRDEVLDDRLPIERESLDPGRYVMLAVRDTGAGMDAQTRSRIFEPFFTTKETGKGTGLGLATVYGIITQSGGRIWVYSEPGRGATFKAFLPCAVESAEERTAVPTPAMEPLRGDEKILLVEDDDAVRWLIENTLVTLGYHVLTAPDPRSAYATASEPEANIDLLLTDVVMPGMSGPELAARVKERRPSLKVLFVSGFSDRSILPAQTASGVFDFLENLSRDQS